MVNKSSLLIIWRIESLDLACFLRTEAVKEEMKEAQIREIPKQNAGGMEW